MISEVCPLFDRPDSKNDKINLLGAWMLHPVNFEVSSDLAMYPELRHIRSMLAAFLANEDLQIIPNEITDVGRGCRSEGGAFVLGKDVFVPVGCEELPPETEILACFKASRKMSEEEKLHRFRFVYEMKNNDGVIICVRRHKAADDR